MIVILFVLEFIIYDSERIKYDALEKRFKRYEETELKEFEYEKSPLHTIVYAGTGTGETNFVKQYLELYHEEERPIIVVCEDKSDWDGYTRVSIMRL